MKGVTPALGGDTSPTAGDIKGKEVTAALWGPPGTFCPL